MSRYKFGSEYDCKCKHEQKFKYELVCKFDS